MASEAEWRRDRDRFVEQDTTGVREHAESASSSSRMPVEMGALAEQFAELAHTLFDTDTVASVLHHIVHATREITPGCDLASVTLRNPDGGFATPVYTDELAEQVDQVQYAADEGPCLEATRADGLGIAWCTDLESDTDHWPTFSPGAAKLGMGALGP